MNILLKFLFKNKLKFGDWGLGIGDWGLGVGDLGFGPILHPQIPIPPSLTPFQTVVFI